MSTLQFLRCLLECDGCKATFGDPHGYNSPREARLAAYLAGWRFPVIRKANGQLGIATSDVCDKCMPTWQPRDWENRNTGRRLRAREAPQSFPEATS
ncbi:hypothetical protein [Streptomyces tendae]|uniref:Uncharacterized protein n=1 Tax=Streptomyces tendae TaxID=1932 RepID=A0ABX5ZWS8_STRTE|nr:hypothetical protein [Streptomyces tendae]QER88602.1 hypothetical protein F3L20_24565 [Streptomyces tendae]